MIALEYVVCNEVTNDTLKAQCDNPHSLTQRDKETEITQPRLTAKILVVLGVLATIGPLSTDLYLPMFTNMSEDLGITAAQVQLTLTGFLIGLGAGPLFVGPLSDRFGRRTILITALSLFIVAGVSMVLFDEIWVVVALRVVQGVAAAAGTVLSRAVVSDLATPQFAVRAMSIIVFSVGLGALAAAPLGALAGSALGWRGALLALSTIGAIMLTLVVLFLPESLPPEKRHNRTNGTGSLVALITAIRTPRVLLYAVILGATYATMMSFIAASPFVAGVILELPVQTFAGLFAASSAAVIVSSALNAWLGPRFGPRRMLAIGQGIAAVSATSMLLLTLADALTPAVFFGLGFGIIAGFGFTMANTTTLALAGAHAVRGSASALMSTTQYSLGALATPFVGLLGSSTAVPMAIVIVICATLALSMTVLTLGRHHRADQLG